MLRRIVPIPILIGISAVLTSACAVAADGDSAAKRERMVAEIAQHGGGIDRARRIEPKVLQAMREVPRHRFVPDALQDRAYENRPLPIGHRQTISQPYIVALMTDLLKPAADHVVLEVGTGSGYQAAVLSRLVRHVYTIEIVAPLASQARQRLAELGYGNVTVREGDGYAGWPEKAPFDSVMVTAGADHVPEPLIRQLKRGGRLVMPVGEPGSDQHLILLEKGSDGRLRRQRIIPVAFVPLTGRGRE